MTHLAYFALGITTLFGIGTLITLLIMLNYVYPWISKLILVLIFIYGTGNIVYNWNGRMN